MARWESAGIWVVVDLANDDAVVSRFRARRKADVDRYLQMAYIGLKRSMNDFEARFIAERD